MHSKSTANHLLPIFVGINDSLPARDGGSTVEMGVEADQRGSEASEVFDFVAILHRFGMITNMRDREYCDESAT